VVGNAAVLVHPENVFEIMRALHRVLLDQSLRDKMKERSYRQAAKFSWEKSVHRLMDAYREILAAKGRSERSPNPDGRDSHSTAGVA
jgi:glycosyltransferase involved in cell wall biosynthesis